MADYLIIDLIRRSKSGLLSPNAEPSLSMRSTLFSAMLRSLSLSPGCSSSSSRIRQLSTYEDTAERNKASASGGKDSGIFSSMVVRNSHGSGPGGAVEHQAWHPARACAPALQAEGAAAQMSASSLIIPALLLAAALSAFVLSTPVRITAFEGRSPAIHIGGEP